MSDPLLNNPIVLQLKDVIEETAESRGVKVEAVGYNDAQQYCKEIEDLFLHENAVVIKNMGGFTAIKAALFPNTDVASKEISVAIKEKTKKDKKQLQSTAEENVFLAKLDTILSKRLSNKIVPTGFSKQTPKKTSGIVREVNLLLSDLHIGAALDPKEVPHGYGETETRRRLAEVIYQTGKYKFHYRKESRLRLHLGGDLIQGDLGHDKRDGNLIPQQINEAWELLLPAIAYLAAQYPEVDVDCTAGNHDRIAFSHPVRAVKDKQRNSYAEVIFNGLRHGCKHLKNVKFHSTQRPYVEYDSFGSRCFGTHGDTVLNPGYPGSAIFVKNLESQINRINASLPNKDEYKLFWVGHVHVATLVNMSNGAKLITNGALIPTDPYGLSIGLFETSCGQTLWESVPGHVVGDYRFIEVNSDTDKDTSLDKILKPNDV